MIRDPRVEKVTLLAWVGEDEGGSGQIGIKQALVPAGIIPLVAIGEHLNRLERPEVKEAMQAQADCYGKTIRLVRFTYAEEVMVLKPRGKG